MLPILLNVTLLDYYYLNFFVILYATIESLTLVYLLLLDYDRLKQIFFKQESNVRGPQFKQRWLKWAVKASAVLIPVILLSIYPYYAKFDRELAGKYIVKQIRPTPAPCKDSVLTKIFIDHSDFVLEYGSYERRFIGNYQYNKTNQTITVIWRYPANMHDTLRVKITPDAEKKVKNFRCFMGKDTFNVKAQKVAPINR